MVRHSRGSYIISSIPIHCCGHTRKTNRLVRCGHPYYRQAFLSRIQLTLHATRRTPHHGASRLVPAMMCLPGRWKPDVLRLGIHCRDARVYLLYLWSYDYAAIHDMSLSAPPPPSAFLYIAKTAHNVHTYNMSCIHIICTYACIHRI